MSDETKEQKMSDETYILEFGLTSIGPLEVRVKGDYKFDDTTGCFSCNPVPNDKYPDVVEWVQPRSVYYLVKKRDDSEE